MQKPSSSFHTLRAPRSLQPGRMLHTTLSIRRGYVCSDHFLFWFKNNYGFNINYSLSRYLLFFPFQNFYPVNFLRNVGIQHVDTPYIFLTDIDFLPMFGLYGYLRKTLQTLHPDHSKKVILMISIVLIYLYCWCINAAPVLNLQKVN